MIPQDQSCFSITTWARPEPHPRQSLPVKIAVRVEDLTTKIKLDFPLAMPRPILGPRVRRAPSYFFFGATCSGVQRLFSTHAARRAAVFGRVTIPCSHGLFRHRGQSILVSPE